MLLSRRDFLKTSSTVAGVAAAGVNLSTVAAAASAATQGSAAAGGTQYVKSTCVHCVNFCGIEVKLEDGVIRTVYPDKARAPYYNVGICPKGVASGFNTYNPYRIKTPLKRTNPKKGLDEDPKWVAISWDEAFDTIAEKLQKIRDDDPRKLIWQHGHGKYLIGDQFPKAFAKAYGTPNLVHRTTTCEAARHVADEVTWGYHGFLPDLDNCELLVNFGGNYFEAEQFSRWLDHATTDAEVVDLRDQRFGPVRHDRRTSGDDTVEHLAYLLASDALGLARLPMRHEINPEDPFILPPPALLHLRMALEVDLSDLAESGCPSLNLLPPLGILASRDRGESFLRLVACISQAQERIGAEAEAALSASML